MLFGAESRFHKKVNSRSGLVVYGKDSETSAHVGPGVYFDKDIEDKRNGWASKSFSTRQPMAPGRRRNGTLRYDDRSSLYISGKMTSSGIALPSNPRMLDTPGPGYYSPPIISTKRPNSASGTMSKSPRKTSTKTVIRGDLIVQGAEHDNGVGPGYYSPPTTSMIRQSHNIHAQRKTPVKPAIEDFPDFHKLYSSGSINLRASHFGNNGIQPSPPKGGNVPRSRSAPGGRRASMPPVEDYYTSPMHNTRNPRNDEQENRKDRNMFVTPSP